jgi:hypothetical protein
MEGTWNAWKADEYDDVQLAPPDPLADSPEPDKPAAPFRAAR